jgi:putative transposase
MYRWRKMGPEQRQETLARRKLQHHPKHSPLHHKAGKGLYLVTATCYEHQPWIGASDERMDHFSTELLKVFGKHTIRIDAWVILPNHYHAVVLTESCPALLRELGKLHGRSSFLWNGEDESRGRKVWFNTLEREISGIAHHIAAIHYVYHNPVKHGYVKKWDDWKWSSASEYLERLGREEVERRWKEYPLLNLGAGWDD